MILKHEIYQDIVDNCDIILTLLQDYELTNDTAVINNILVYLVL